MASDHRDALYDIANLCIKSRQYTRRTQSIHNIAMVALGMTDGQRVERHQQAVKFAADYHAGVHLRQRLKNKNQGNQNEQSNIPT